MLKDTGARTAEALKLKWVDIDEKSCVIRINNPVKGSLARAIKVSAKTIAVINALPKQANTFSTQTSILYVQISMINAKRLQENFRTHDYCRFASTLLDIGRLPWNIIKLKTINGCSSFLGIKT